VGNIIIAALSDMAGGFCEGVEQAARFLRTKGRVLPAATESLTLVVRYADGTVTRGESVVHEVGKQVSKVSVEPTGIPAPPGVIEAIQAADVLVLAPGSLFTSTIPALLGGGVREAIADFGGPVIYVANAMTQQGETGDFTVSDHVRAITEHVGPVVTDVLVHSGDLPPDILARYEVEEATPVAVDLEVLHGMGLRVKKTDLLSRESCASVRHDPVLLAREVGEIALVRL
jgi:uncharacterized cofD-like protein